MLYSFEVTSPVSYLKLNQRKFFISKTFIFFNSHNLQVSPKPTWHHSSTPRPMHLSFFSPVSILICCADLKTGDVFLIYFFLDIFPREPNSTWFFLLFFRLNKLFFESVHNSIVVYACQCSIIWKRKKRDYLTHSTVTQAEKKVSNFWPFALASFVRPINYAILEVYGNLTPQLQYPPLSLISNGTVEIYVIYSNWYLRKEEETLVKKSINFWFLRNCSSFTQQANGKITVFGHFEDVIYLIK